MCVEHDRRPLSLGLGLPAERVKRLVNGLEPQVKPGDAKHWKVSFMPLNSRRQGGDGVTSNSPGGRVGLFRRSQVFPRGSIAALQSCWCFSPSASEGFGLPVAEAMACGCAVVGYTGLGGRELFDLAAGYGLGTAVEPGDWLGCVQGVERINHALRFRQDDVAHQLEVMAGVVQKRYSMTEMHRSVAEAIAQL